MQRRATILIPARNSGKTIHRAVASAVAQGPFPIILIDDHSSDGTVEKAREAGGTQLSVIRPPQHETLGATRQFGLRAVETRYGVWLDADDELLAGRVDRMIRTLEDDCSDLVADEAELYDGASGDFRGILEIPGFLLDRHPLARLFERNYLPAPGVVGFRADFAKRIDYDARLHGAEDIDFLLRSIRAGARFSLLPIAGYRLYAYPQSISRSIENQRRMYRELLAKHDYEDVRNLYHEAGHDRRIAAWGLASMALFREDYRSALTYIAEAEARMKDPAEVLEPEGACDAPEGWRVAFHRGTTLLLIGRDQEAADLLKKAEELRPSAEGANNLGVALRRMRDERSALSLFQAALSRLPSFHDAQINLSDSSSMRITTHPLRSYAARNDYSRCRA